MIELPEQQLQALERHEVVPPRMLNPRTKETFVLLRDQEFERLTHLEYDNSPWTRANFFLCIIHLEAFGHS